MLSRKCAYKSYISNIYAWTGFGIKKTTMADIPINQTKKIISKNIKVLFTVQFRLGEHNFSLDTFLTYQVCLFEWNELSDTDVYRCARECLCVCVRDHAWVCQCVCSWVFVCAYVCMSKFYVLETAPKMAIFYKTLPTSKELTLCRLMLRVETLRHGVLQ